MRLVPDLYQFTTNDRIQFVGKHFTFFAHPIYYIGFGLTYALLALDLFAKPIRKIVVSVVIWVLVFAIVLINICAFDAHFKLMQCTACNDGTRQLQYYEVNAGLILGVAAIIAGIPSLVRIVKSMKTKSS